MGKLHKIRKAVEANPEQFIYGSRDGVLYSYGGKYDPRSAYINDAGQVVTGRGSQTAHCNFVRKVLRELGYEMRDKV